VIGQKFQSRTSSSNLSMAAPAIYYSLRSSLILQSIGADLTSPTNSRETASLSKLIRIYDVKLLSKLSSMEGRLRICDRQIG
jgi:hypothetical protein